MPHFLKVLFIQNEVNRRFLKNGKNNGFGNWEILVSRWCGYFALSGLTWIGNHLSRMGCTHPLVIGPFQG